ncbi:MAG TPA: hypothetical protein DEB06_09175 [Phycisphaerales bacterium]|nr:hypothetical protein [Phycisphaerales bacterium]
MCAAGFGEDLGQARQAAISAAQCGQRGVAGGRAAEASGVARIAVVPLSGAPAWGSGTRFVGYAMVSAPAE